MWLSCQAIIWISVLAGLFWVFANQVTYYMLVIFFIVIDGKDLIACDANGMYDMYSCIYLCM